MLSHPNRRGAGSPKGCVDTGSLWQSREQAEVLGDREGRMMTATEEKGALRDDGAQAWPGAHMGTEAKVWS